MAFNWLANPRWKIGVRYVHGKVLIYQGVSSNPDIEFDKPTWAVDIREILLISFVGVGALLFIFKEQYGYAKELLLILSGYIMGRTVPGGIGS